jgi:hypothetical protein
MIHIFNATQLPCQAIAIKETRVDKTVTFVNESARYTLPENTVVWVLRIKRETLTDEGSYAELYARSPDGREICITAADFEKVGA